MEKETLIVFDTEGDFIKYFERNLEDEFDSKYIVKSFIPEIAKDDEQVMYNKHIEDVESVLLTSSITAIFVDINLSNKEKDIRGIKLAEILQNRFLDIPVFSITSKSSNETDFDAITDASLNGIVIMRSSLDGKDFSAKRFKHILKKGGERLEYLNYLKNTTSSNKSKSEIEKTSIIETRNKNFRLKRPAKEITPRDLNEYRLPGLEYLFNQSLLKSIIGTCFSSTEVDEFEYSIIDPGISGAYLFKVSFQFKGKERNWALKISTFGEGESLFTNSQEARKLIYSIIQHNKENFISLNEEYSCCVDQFDCCVHEFVENKDTLSNYLYKKHELADDSDLVKIIDTIMEKYEYKNYEEKLKAAWDIRGIKTRPWTGGDYSGIQFSGLQIKPKYRNDILGKIIKTLNLFTDTYLLDTLDISDTGIILNKLISFINEGKWSINKTIDGNAENKVTVPISYIHGDFNAGNILVNNKTGLQPVFIDLAQLAENQHAMMDIGKLSVEMEKRVMPDYKLLENKINLKSWCIYHKMWMSEPRFDLSTLNPEISIEKIYVLNDAIKKYALKGWEDYNVTISEKEAYEQFLMVRLQYFLRMIGQDHVIPQKRLFAIKASIDILEFLDQ